MRQQRLATQQPRQSQCKKTPTWQQMHPLTSALLQRQAPSATGTQMSAEEETVPKMAPGHKERQPLCGQGFGLLSTLQGDDDGFELTRG